MAENKKSFLMYCDWINQFELMPPEFAGRLILHIFKYVNDMNPETDDFALKMAFEPIKQQFKRDLKKYEGIAERNRVNGSKGGRPKKQTQINPENPVGYLETQRNPSKPKKPDTDTDTDINRDINISFVQFWELYDKKRNRLNAEKKWNKLKDDERTAIMEYIPKYKEANPDKYFRKDPCTFINQRGWEDELIQAPKQKPELTEEEIKAQRVKEYYDKMNKALQ